MLSIKELIPVLQTAIGPVILISGVGLLLLSMTNRFSRVIERARNLLSFSETVDGAIKTRTLAQIDILWGQARMIRQSILFASVSILSAALLIIVLFITVLFGWEDVWLLSAIFITCMCSLIASILAFMTDINRSLSAFRMELYGHKNEVKVD